MKRARSNICSGRSDKPCRCQRATTSHESTRLRRALRGFASERDRRAHRCAIIWSGDSSLLQATPYVDPAGVLCADNFRNNRFSGPEEIAQ